LSILHIAFIAKELLPEDKPPGMKAEVGVVPATTDAEF
jgi:hypothetical protein